MDNHPKLGPVLVTGASGFIGSWVVKYLLEAGYVVHGAIPSMQEAYKVMHLTQLASKLKRSFILYEANLLNKESLASAIKGCSTVIHIAAHMWAQEKKITREAIQYAVEGIQNLLATANTEESVTRVVFTSSLSSLFGDAIELADKEGGIFSEQDWNLGADQKYLPRAYAITRAEKSAWVMAQAQDRWSLVTLQPGLVMGPTLSRDTESASARFGLSLVNGQSRWGVPDIYLGLVDVREVARAHVLAAFQTEASGRYPLCSEVLGILEMAALIRTEYGKKYPLPKRTLPRWIIYLFARRFGYSAPYIKRNLGFPIRINTLRSTDELGVVYRSVVETLTDQMRAFEEKGML